MFTAAGKSAAASSAVYIEDVFSTYLYTATGPSSGQTITNNIDLSGKGGMLWIKNRTDAGTYPVIVDTARGANKWIYTSSTAAAATSTSSVTAFNSNGFTLGTDNGSGDSNSVNYAYSSPTNMVSWTFRKQAKFFDVVTYTGNGVAGRTVSHNLGSTPGCIIVKRTNDAKEWNVYHRSMTANGHLELDSTAAKITSAQAWNNTEPTSTVFTVGNDLAVNGNGSTYVAYLFAHDAGGFGASGSDNVITCGSVVGGGTTSVTLGYEPQWILMKNASAAQDWWLVDNMRGLPAPSANARLLIPNKTDAEAALSVNINATGFTTAAFSSGQTYIYIAIRRGPMKTPTSGTSVFSPNATTATTGTVITPNFPVDAQIIQYRTPAGGNILWQDRLRGVNTTTTENNNPVLISNDTSAESSTFASTRAWSNTGFQIASALTGQDRIYWSFRRAPGFFDVVCYTGTGSATTFNHNLTVVPELMIVKSRNNATNWAVYCAYLGGTNPANRYVLLNSSNSFGGTSVYWNDTAPTSTVFTVGTTAATNTSAYTYVNYLFATCAGVSKVGSYTGTGALQTIDCGFAAGARFVLIKRTDSTGDWWVYDSARGITSGNDPYLFLNSTAAEVTNTNYVDTASTGFQVTAAAPAELNANGGTYIFLAIA